MKKKKEHSDEVQTISISCLDAAATLSDTRNNQKVAKESKISYSQIAAWHSNIKSGRAEEYCNVFIMEFYRRINTDEVKRVNKKYGLKPSVSVDFLTKNIFQAATIENYQQSKVKWKREIIKYFCTFDERLLSVQIDFINEYLRCKEGVGRPSCFEDVSVIRNIKHTELSHL